MKTLNLAALNVQYEIVGFLDAQDKHLRRFFELGFCVGEKVKVISKSLMGKVFLIEIRGYLLSVRKNLLEKIEVR